MKKNYNRGKTLVWTIAGLIKPLMPTLPSAQLYTVPLCVEKAVMSMCISVFRRKMRCFIASTPVASNSIATVCREASYCFPEHAPSTM